MMGRQHRERILDLKQLQRFAVVAEEKSFARASEILAVSQPSVSRSIQLLEDSLGVTLFDRTPQGVAVTPYGRALLPYARSIINDRARAIGAIAAVRKDLGNVLRLGVTRRAAASGLPAAIGQLAASSPRLTVYLLDDSFPVILDQLREGEIDLAFGIRGAYDNLQGLAFEPLARTVATFIVRREHPLAARTDITFADLSGGVWLVSEDQSGRDAWRRMFESRRLPVPRVAVYASSPEVVRRCVLAADLVAVIYQEDVQDDLRTGALVQVSPDKDPYFQDVGLFRRAEVSLSPEQTLVADMLRDLCARGLAVA